MTSPLAHSLKVLPLIVFAHEQPGQAATANMAGNWDSVTLSGSLGDLTPTLHDFRWLIMDQSRLRNDGPQGFRYSENLLFSQIGYALNEQTSVWLGYAHDWIHSLDKPSYQESRSYEDFLWNVPFGDLKFTSRTRLEQRIRQDTGDLGVRARQFLQLSHPLRFIHNNLSAYVNDEVFAYLNSNTFGPTGFSENRAAAGLAFQFIKQLGVDLGYLGQYVVGKPGNDLFTHNVQLNLRYQF
jgi:hypothetical protein